jgi:hypothetical protein
VCGTVGNGFGKPGTMQDIQAYRLPCHTARQVGRRVAKRAWPSRCFTSGCRAKIRGIGCRLYALRADETTGLQGRAVQRVACRRGRGTMSGWSVP